MTRFTSALAAALALACTTLSPGYLGISQRMATGSSAIRPTGLVAAFDFETLTADGRLRDFSPHENHATLHRRLTADGPFGKAQVFDSVADRIHLPANPTLDLDGPLTIAAWLRVDELNLHQHVMACDDKYALWITPANQFRLGDTRGGGYSTTEGFVQTNRWYSVVAVLRVSRGDTMNVGDVEIYVDGDPAEASVVLRAQAVDRPVATWGSAELHTEDACYIGFESHQGNDAHQSLPFRGAIDELLIFSRALTAEEIAAFHVHDAELVAQTLLSTRRRGRRTENAGTVSQRSNVR